MPDLTTAVGEINLKSKEWTLLIKFVIRVGNFKYWWELNIHIVSVKH